ncbi:uncharacterized protein LOC121808986 [Salvia splendens]|uniref:uncharacterized protein LOC121808986 n=1 Tax=Salvia splendens TaxID=180675 RepID=UPI001C2644B3|nr:uncharacterized protein LOC121808986 [Salvia splendens]
MLHSFSLRFGVPPDVIDQISTLIELGVKDVRRLSLTSHGEFSVTSAWESIRTRLPKREIFGIIWNQGLTPTISVFIWRLLFGRLSVDEKFQRRGIELASRHWRWEREDWFEVLMEAFCVPSVLRWDTSGDSTPGPDGFTLTFFQKSWSIVGLDFTDAIDQFFKGAFLPRCITATTIVLLPKRENPAMWSDYRPISLCNVINKVITKILTARLSPLLPLVISPNQSGFVKDRLLNDNSLLTQKMFHELSRCRPSPNVALKLDMPKAYDRVAFPPFLSNSLLLGPWFPIRHDAVQWPFLLKVMQHMGFPEPWLSLVDRCIGSC